VITVSSEAGVVYSARVNVAFSANGRWGACLNVCEEDVILEHWSFISREATCRTITDVTVNRRTSPLPLDDGRILLLHHEGAPISGHYALVLLRPDGRGVLRRYLADLSGLAAYFLPSPSSSQLGFVITRDDPERSTIWRLSSAAPHTELLLRIPGSLSGGVWLDGDRSVLAVNQSCDSNCSSGIVIDVRQRTWRRVWSVSDQSVDRIVLASSRSNLIVVTTNSGGEERLGWGIFGDSTTCFPETVHRAGYVRTALSLDPSGEQALLHELTGAVSRLLVYRPADDRLIQIPSPPGVISSPVSWSADFIRLRYSAAHQPPTLASVRLVGTGPETTYHWSLGQDDHDGEPDFASAQLIELSGPGGPMQAITYGGSTWRSCPQLVVALHGGPLASWRFEFDPLFQCLSRAGVAVVAPNYRGSIGYGDDHVRPVVGNWGGPDLEDVLHLGEILGRDRGQRHLPTPVLLGVSYGAFLALLAASHQPMLWSACVALAPFLSGPRLYRCAGPVARQRIEQLGGLNRIDDTVGSRDVLRVCASLSVPLLLVHGSKDETIPVEQSRLLRRRLCELGRTEGIDFEYLEADLGHQEVAQAWPKDLRQKIVNFCLARSN